ncbi:MULTISPECIES: FMN-binding protein [unclassified Streptomyces]|uniref:FMN-binding protein n=1 Tax=unclassified Streptomyces TaxID=2593676 RepID=UPI003826FFFB
MRRAVLTAASTTTLVVLLLALKPHQSDRQTIAVPAPAPSGTTAASPAPSTSPQGGTSAAGGTYTGDPVNTQYGAVQVSATVRAGKLTAVTVLQVPSGDGHSRRIADYAVPRLTQEALTAHSAHIDSVSGASYTSQGYIESLQSALDKAGA